MDATEKVSRAEEIFNLTFNSDIFLNGMTFLILTSFLLTIIILISQILSDRKKIKSGKGNERMVRMVRGKKKVLLFMVLSLSLMLILAFTI